jgi:hypothetical protein
MSHIINANIKSFWEKAGYEVHPILDQNGEYPPSCSWRIFKYTLRNDGTRDCTIMIQIAITYDGDRETVYRVDWNFYSEAQMLRIIKLKAFL